MFEVEAGSGEKVEEFVVLHQEPSASETISPRVARPYIQALQSINLDPQDEQKQGGELADQEATEVDPELESQAKEDPAHIEELNAVMEQVGLLFLAYSLKTGASNNNHKLKMLFCIYLSLKQLTPIERYALHYLEYLHISDDERTLKVMSFLIK